MPIDETLLYVRAVWHENVLDDERAKTVVGCAGDDHISQLEHRVV